MKKLFISQPMKGKSDADILAERKKAIKSAEEKIGEPVEVIDSFFQETVCKSIRLGFDSRLVLETLKAFTCDNIALGFTSPRTPMIVEAEDSDMKAMVLPVAIREA